MNHRASAINIAVFGNLDLYLAFAKNIGNCLGSWMISNTGYLNHTLCKDFSSLHVSCSEVIFGFVTQALVCDTSHLLRLILWNLGGKSGAIHSRTSAGIGMVKEKDS